MTGASAACRGKAIYLRLPADRVCLLALEGATLLAFAVLVAIFVHSVIPLLVAEYSPLLKMAANAPLAASARARSSAGYAANGADAKLRFDSPLNEALSHRFYWPRIFPD